MDQKSNIVNITCESNGEWCSYICFKLDDKGVVVAADTIIRIAIEYRPYKAVSLELNGKELAVDLSELNLAIRKLNRSIEPKRNNYSSGDKGRLDWRKDFWSDWTVWYDNQKADAEMLSPIINKIVQQIKEQQGDL